MASQERTSVVNDIVKVTFRSKASMSDDCWKETGILLQKANENRWSEISQEPSSDLLDSTRSDSQNIPQSFNSVQAGLCALLRRCSQR